MKTICLTLCRRPTETKRILESLERCYGFNGYQVLMSCDFDYRFADNCHAVRDMAYEFAQRQPLPRIRAKAWVNKPGLGIDLSKTFLLEKAFEISDFVIFLEDDLLISQDILRYFEAMDERYRDDPTVLSVTGYNRYTEQVTHDWTCNIAKYTVARRDGFKPWSWGMWKDRYEAICGLDGAKYVAATGARANGMFDHNMVAYAREHNMKTIYPLLPRATHAGWELAEHTPSKEFLMREEYSELGAYNMEMPDVTNEVWNEV